MLVIIKDQMLNESYKQFFLYGSGTAKDPKCTLMGMLMHMHTYKSLFFSVGVAPLQYFMCFHFVTDAYARKIVVTDILSY